MAFNRYRTGSLVTLILLASGVGFWLLFRPPAVQRLASSIQTELSELRGRSFEAPVVVRVRGRAERLSTLDQAFSRMPSNEAYGEVIQALGLYRGPLIRDPGAMMQRLISAGPSGSIAYYDAAAKVVLIETSARGSVRLGSLAHEIYHAFQDQHFNLTSYLIDKAREGSLGADEILARQSVVEGEATYAAIVWAAVHAGNRAPDRGKIAEAVRRRSRMDEEMLSSLRRTEPSPRDTRWMAALRETPAFMYRNFSAPYSEGVSFVQAVQRGGWSEVEKLYLDYPPESTEQILHPEKWFARERPRKLRMPAFDTNALFSGWTLLGQDALGELSMRSVFREQGLDAEAERAAEGWGGDRFAVFKRARDGAILLLWSTSWDTQADASEFAQAYEQLLGRKYANHAVPARVELSGNDVYIVEGGDAGSIPAYLAFMRGGAVRDSSEDQ
jgi:hypothetical protein